MLRMTRQFIASFLYLFCLANFVVGTMAYIFDAHQMRLLSDNSLMGFLGIATAIVAGVNVLKSPHLS